MTEFDKQIINEMNEVLRSRKDEVANNYPLVRRLYQEAYDFPELDPVRHEVCLCLILGLPQAAITLTNHLLEAFLKYVLSYHHSIQNIETDKPKVGVQSLVEDLKEGNELYTNKELNFTINQACSKGLITKEQKERLHEYREVFRNAYGHADKRKTFGEADIPVQGVSIEEGKLRADPESTQQIFDLPIVHGLVQAYHARANALPYFQYVDGVIRDTLPKVFPSMNSDESS